MNQAAALHIKIDLSRVFRRVSVREKALFTRALSAMISAGLPLIKALNLLLSQTENKYFASVISDVIKRLEEGEGIAQSLSHHSDVFDQVYISSIRAAESSGKFDEILRDLAEQLEKDYKLETSVRSALAYPIFIVCAMIVVMIILMVAVIPKLQDLFTGINAQIPLATRMLIATSGFFQRFWYVIAAILIFAIYWGRSFLKTEQGKNFSSRMIIKIPVVKELFKNIYMSRFTRVFGILIGAGVPIIEAVKLMSLVINNKVYERILVRVADQIQRGVQMSSLLGEYPSEFHPIVSQMMAVGEQTGKLDEVMQSLARFFDDEVAKRLGALTSLLEPILLIIIGAGVGVIVFSVIMPIYKFSTNIQ